ncbi:MAG: TPM domain-containing protein [Ignavibacteria bacterium]
MKNWLDKYLTNYDLQRIKEEIEKVEQSTSGQIKLSIREKRKFYEKLYKPHELAVRDFEKLGIALTKHQTGVLIFLIFEERFYDILADEGIHSKIPDAMWADIESRIIQEFRNEGYLNGILHIIDRIGSVLKEEFPRESDDTNEIPDDVSVN